MSSGDELPTVEEVYAIHEEIEESYDLKFTGTRAYFPDDKIRGVLEDAQEADSVFEQAAILMKRLAHIHVFEDGNKRTAWLTTITYLDRHDFEPASRGQEAELVMKRLGRFDYSELAEWLEAGQIDEDRLQ